MENRRIEILDGFRALAILMVLSFHYFSRWTPPRWTSNYYPYGGKYAEFPLFNFGFLGVEFFFVISGFVISLTLFGSRSIREFVAKRIARLWPAMFICSLITLIALVAIPQTMFEAKIRNLVPSLLFIDPYLLQKVFGISSNWMDNAYWSLFVEVRFYFWAAIIYFSFPKRFLEAFSAFSAGVLMVFLTGKFCVTQVQTATDLIFFPAYVAWFLMGVGFYHLYENKKTRLAHSVIAASLLVQWLKVWFKELHGSGSSVMIGHSVAFGLIVLVFYGFVYRPKWLACFGWSFVSQVGAASYSLYLLHQNLGVALIRYASERFGFPGEIVTVCVMGLLIVGAIGIYRYWEIPAKKLVLRLLLPRAGVV